MATFQISATTATFGAVVRGASQEAGDLERLTCSVNMTDVAAWTTLQSLVTTKYAILVPFSGDPIVDVVRGPGEGTLIITGLGTVTAILTSLTRNTYTRTVRTLGTATFLITDAWS